MTHSTTVSANQDPFVKVHPSDVYVVDNHPATLNCKAEGSPPPIITWYKDGSPLSDEHPVTSQESNNRVQLDDGSLFFLRITKKLGIRFFHPFALILYHHPSIHSHSLSPSIHSLSFFITIHPFTLSLSPSIHSLPPQSFL